MVKKPVKTVQPVKTVKKKTVQKVVVAKSVTRKPASVKKTVASSVTLSSEEMEKMPQSVDVGSEAMESGLPGFEDEIAEEFPPDLDDDMPKDIAEAFDGETGFGALTEDRDNEVTEDDLSEELGTEKYFRDDADTDANLEEDDLSSRW